MHEKQCGADSYLTKPFDIYELLDLVKKYASGFAAGQNIQANLPQPAAFTG